MLLADLLRVMLHRGAPHQRTARRKISPLPIKILFELPDDALVDPIAKILNGVELGRQHNGLVVVRDLTLGLRVAAQSRPPPPPLHSEHVEVLPDLLQQLVHVPLQLRRDHDVVRHSVKQVQLLHRDRVDLVHHVQTRRVYAALSLVAAPPACQRRTGCLR
jgi:hypothetical protein